MSTATLKKRKNPERVAARRILDDGPLKINKAKDDIEAADRLPMNPRPSTRLLSSIETVGELYNLFLDVEGGDKPQPRSEPKAARERLEKIEAEIAAAKKLLIDTADPDLQSRIDEINCRLNELRPRYLHYERVKELPNVVKKIEADLAEEKAKSYPSQDRILQISADLAGAKLRLSAQENVHNRENVERVMKNGEQVQKEMDKLLAERKKLEKRQLEP
jgi:hypothetical protein